jgi:hypothetical protein
MQRPSGKAGQTPPKTRFLSRVANRATRGLARTIFSLFGKRFPTTRAAIASKIDATFDFVLFRLEISMEAE